MVLLALVVEANQESFAARNMVVNDVSPLFLNYSEYPRTILVSQVFDGTCFGMWKRAMIIALSAKNKLSFVDGSYPKLVFDSPDLQHLIRYNVMVISWELNSLTKEISRSIIYSIKASTI